MLYKGGCHCGKIAIEVNGELEAVVSCNCSICSRKGALLWALPRDRVRVLAADEDVGTYVFNRHAIEHRFCRTCGMHPFAEDAGAGGTAYINVRCLENIDPASLQVLPFDGRSA